MLTENAVVLQYLGDRASLGEWLPPLGDFRRYRVLEWVNFITTELHKNFGPMFRPTTPDAYKQIAKENIAGRFTWIDSKLAGKQYLMGDTFTAPDAYLYVMTRWAKRMEFDLDQWPNLKAFSARVEARPKVQEALKAEGLA